MPTKQQLRQLISDRFAQNALSPHQTETVNHHLQAFIDSRDFTTIALYHALPDEVDLTPTINHLDTI